MRFKIISAVAAATLLLAFAVACSQQRGNPSAKNLVKNTLKANGLGNVNVDEDRDKGVITLKGDVKSDQAKAQAQQLAAQAAPGRVIANELAVRPEGMEGQARKVESNTDDAIEHDFEAAIAAHKWDNQHIRYTAKNGVLTLKGDVDTPAQRTEVQNVAKTMPGVQQVVNELQIKGQKR